MYGTSYVKPQNSRCEWAGAGARGCRPHQTLTKKAGESTTLAMAAGIARAPWSPRQLAELPDA